MDQGSPGTGAIEFWFHGYDHAVHSVDGTQFNEFNGRCYEDQKQRFDRSQRLARQHLGFVFHAFGPGGGVGNGLFDANTVRVMADEPEMRIWLYPQPLDAAGKKLEAQGKVVILDRVWAVNLESKPGLPDYQRLVDGYAKYPQRKYFVLQGHPNKWTEEHRWDEFVKIIEFLKARGCPFMTPSEYVASLSAGQNHEVYPLHLGVDAGFDRGPGGRRAVRPPRPDAQPGRPGVRAAKTGRCRRAVDECVEEAAERPHRRGSATRPSPRLTSARLPMGRMTSAHPK